MSSDKPISDLAEGVTQGLLEWSAQKISFLIQKLKDRKLAFIEEEKTIEIIKEQYRSGESLFYKERIKDKDLLFLVRMGLTLRKLENEEERLLGLRDKIFKKWGISGLHVAEFVQNGVLNRYIGVLIEELASEEDLEKKIIEVLRNIEKHALFISGTSRISDIIRKAGAIVDAHSPSIFVVAGSKSAVKTVQDSIEPLKAIMEDYTFEHSGSKEKEILFFKKEISSR